MINNAILITGATGLIGSYLVRHLQMQGKSIIATSRSINKLEELRDSLGNLKDNVHIVCQDLMDNDASIELRKKIETQGISVSQIINNARSLEHLKQDENGVINERQFSDEVKLDVIVPYKIVNEFLYSNNHNLKEIVNISSMYGVVVPNPKLYDEGDIGCPINYGVAKAAMNHITKELAVRLSKNNVRVNSIAFGGIQGRTSKEFNERYANLCPNGRMLKLDEVAGPVDFLLSKQASGITGHVLVVDGGWSLW